MTVEEALKLADEHDIHVEEHQKNVGHIINLFFEYVVLLFDFSNDFYYLKIVW